MTFANNESAPGGAPGEDQAPAQVPYDTFVDWEARLARELPFFEALFDRIDARRVVDVGCGSGMHAIAFAKSGLEVVGIDPSESMLNAAEQNAADAGVEIRFERGVFEDATELAGEKADAVVALGNGLPHVEGVEGLRRALRSLAETLRPGGVLVLHLINHERLSRNDVRMLPPKHRATPEGDRVFVRMIDHVDGGFVFGFLTLTREPVGAQADDAADPRDSEATPWEVSDSRSFHTAMPPDVLSAELEAAGFGDMRMYGNHSGKELDAAEDESVIVVAVR